MQKINVLVAGVEAGKKVLQAAIKDYVSFFKDKQSEFKGVRSTYAPREGCPDDDSKRGFEKVVTTVDEKLDYFEKSYSHYINDMLNLEASNAAGIAKIAFTIDGKNFGVLSTVELLRLKEIVESLVSVYSEIPVRSDKIDWKLTADPEFANRNIFEKPKVSGITRHGKKDSKILKDPNVEMLGDKSKYTPQVVTIETMVEVGDYTVQEFSGAYSHVQRAGILKRCKDLLVAIQKALKEANDVQQKSSELTADKIFDFLHRG